jgi:phage-related holin
MIFLKYSLTFKILVVAVFLATVFVIGVNIDGKPGYAGALLLMWYIQLGSIIPGFFYGDLSSNGLLNLMNFISFAGSIVCAAVINKVISRGNFRKRNKTTILSIFFVSAFCITVVLHYVDMFVNQNRTFFTKDYAFATEYSLKAINSWDGVICISILIQITQALVNTALKRSLKR